MTETAADHGWPPAVQAFPAVHLSIVVRKRSILQQVIAFDENLVQQVANCSAAICSWSLCFLSSIHSLHWQSDSTCGPIAGCAVFTFRQLDVCHNTARLS